MENIIRDYLRILDIDPYGHSIRLINISHDQSINLSKIFIRQYRNDIQIDKNLTLTSYIFKDQIRPLLRSGEVVTIYSKGSDQFKFNIEPYIFIAENIRQWLINDDIQTELSINETVFDSNKFDSYTSNDIPTLFLNRFINSEQCQKKTISNSNDYTRFIFPYCLSNNNIVNPHTSAKLNQFERNICYQKNQIVKHFDSYPRRLTTMTSQQIQSTNDK